MKKIFRLAPFLSILWAYLHIAFFVFLELIDKAFIIFVLLIVCLIFHYDLEIGEI